MAAIPRLAGLSWSELIHTAWRKSVSNNVVNRAAELAFWFLLGFFPMLVSGTSTVTMISSTPGSQGTVMKYVGELLPFHCYESGATRVGAERVPVIGIFLANNIVG